MVRIDGDGVESSNCKQMLRTSLRDASRAESGAVSGCGGGGCAWSMCWNRAVVVVAAVVVSEGVGAAGGNSKAGNFLSKNALERLNDCMAARISITFPAPKRAGGWPVPSIVVALLLN